MKASLFIIEAYEGQVDDDREKATDHMFQVCSIIIDLYPDDIELQQAALLHDTIEDGKATYAELISNFGTPVANLVREVSHEGSRSTGYYFPRLKTRRGIMLKFADRLSNISRMESWSAERRQQYLNKSKFWKDEGEKEAKKPWGLSEHVLILPEPERGCK